MSRAPTAVEPVARVLLVDDRPENLLALENILKPLNLEIVKALSGNQALGKLLDTRFACILLDVQMPDMDGFEVARLVRQDELTRDIPILFVTAYSRGEEEMFRGYESGAVDYLYKPLHPSVVRSKVAIFADLFRKQETIRAQTDHLEQLNRELTVSNADLERFAYLATHDLKEPLRMVSLYCQLLEQRFRSKLDSQALGYLDHAVEGAKRMHQLLSDVLAYSKVRTEPIPFDDVDMGSLARKALADLHQLIEETGAEVGLGELPTLTGNETQLRQVLQNLIQNALKYRSPDRKPRVEITAEQKDREWIFAVSDNGIGIESQYFGQIFDLFKRLHTKEQYPGTGLGLAISKRVVSRHGGRMWVGSTFGEGTTFYFSIPLEPKPQ